MGRQAELADAVAQAGDAIGVERVGRCAVDLEADLDAVESEARDHAEAVEKRVSLEGLGPAEDLHGPPRGCGNVRIADHARRRDARNSVAPCPVRA